jgi:hypothetical protein
MQLGAGPIVEATSEEKAPDAVRTIGWRRLRKAFVAVFAVVTTAVSAWWLDRQQQGFGEEFAGALMLKRPEIRLDKSNFEGEIAALELSVSDEYYQRANLRYVEQLGTAIREVYCAHGRGSAEQLKVSVLHVIVSVRGRDSSRRILNHALSPRACA